MSSVRSWMPLWVIPAGFLAAGATIWLRLKVVDLSYRVDQADRQLREALKSRERAELRLAEQRSPARLEKLARERFGLARPLPGQIVRMPPE